MTPKELVVPEWEHLRTDESRQVEELLQQHFRSASAYRYNSASIRVRVVDECFKGLSREQRDDLVEPILSQLDASIQADIMNLLLLYPGEELDSVRAQLFNEEFEHPSRSML